MRSSILAAKTRRPIIKQLASSSILNRTLVSLSRRHSSITAHHPACSFFSRFDNMKVRRLHCCLWTASAATVATSACFLQTATAFSPLAPTNLLRQNHQRKQHSQQQVRCFAASKSRSKAANRSRKKKDDIVGDNDEDADYDDYGADQPIKMDPSSLPFASTYHAPVMWKECIDALLTCERAQQQPRTEHQQGLIFIDGTLGGGGHSEALLQALQPGDIVFGCDVDANALQEASRRLESYMGNNVDTLPLFVPVQSNFAQLATILPLLTYPNNKNDGNDNDGSGADDDDSDDEEQHQQQPTILSKDQHCIDGILLDLGVSSHQIDTPERGFAFMKDGPLDMRMMGTHDPTTYNSASTLTAADLCNELEEVELARIFQQYGDEAKGRAYAIAKAIVQSRPLTTTGQLQEAVATVVPQFNKLSKRKGRTATLARVFQSLRIVVNREDKVLQQVLEEVCPNLLRPGGRLVVLSYHSMEDRATKRVMRDGTIAKIRGGPERDIYGDYAGPTKPFKPLGKFQKASAEEVANNSRARSATLRIAERLEVDEEDE